MKPRFIALIFVLWSGLFTGPVKAVVFPFSFWQTPSSGGSNPWITSQSLGSPRTYGDPIGLGFTVGGANITITDLGRMVLSGNSGNTTLYLLSGPTSSLTIAGQVTINLSGGTVGQYLYGSLGTPIVLTAGSSYYLVQWDGTNQFYDDPTTITTTSDASSIGSWYASTGSLTVLQQDQTAPHAYVPTNFKYHL